MTVYILLAILSHDLNGYIAERTKIVHVYSSEERCEGAKRQLSKRMLVDDAHMQCHMEKVHD